MNSRAGEIPALLMIRRKRMALEYVADFETTAVRVYNIKTRKLDRQYSEAWVCAWALIPVELEPDPAHIIHGRSIDTFMAAVAELVRDQVKGKTKKRRSVTVFTHNLKFDGDFILWWLLHGHGEILEEVRENVLYSFKAAWDGIEVTFRDSLKIFPQSAAKIGELYGIRKLRGEWDYEKYRTPETPVSAEEWVYVDHDVMIISRALADYRRQGYVENTQAAIAYNDRLRRTYPRFKKTLALSYKEQDYERFRNMFPKEIRPLPFELHKHLMLGYFGGISYLNPMYARQDITMAHSFDVHSMYPSQMHDRPLPIGDPLIIENPSQEEAWRIIRNYPCVMVDWEELSLRLKSPEHFPVLMFPTAPQTSVRMEGKIIRCRNEIACLTGLDCRMMASEYEIESGMIKRIYFFSSRRGHYKEFVDYWMGIKQDADRVLNDPASTGEERSAAKTRRSLAKVMLNSSYGKDGTKLLRLPHKTYLSGDDQLEARIEVEITKIEYYLPSAIFICAWARWQLWNAVRLVRPYFIYCDTDSVKVTQEGYENLMRSPDFDVDDYRLGAWGYEGEYLTARFVRQKTYSYTQLNKTRIPERHYVVCGAPNDIKSVMRIDDFRPGMVITLDQIHAETDPETGKPRQGRLNPVRVRGGVILEETGFQISKIDNWDEYQGRNMPIDIDLLRKVINDKEYKEERI